MTNDFKCIIYTCCGDNNLYTLNFIVKSYSTYYFVMVFSVRYLNTHLISPDNFQGTKPTDII